MTQKVRARFWVQKITKQAISQGQVSTFVELAPVIRATGQPGYDPEANVEWSKYTPSGKIELMITNSSAAKTFEANLTKDVAITFEFIDGEPATE
jgi:hypothetical protein